MCVSFSLQAVLLQDRILKLEQELADKQRSYDLRVKRLEGSIDRLREIASCSGKGRQRQGPSCLDEGPCAAWWWGVVFLFVRSLGIKVRVGVRVRVGAFVRFGVAVKYQPTESILIKA